MRLLLGLLKRGMDCAEKKMKMVLMFQNDNTDDEMEADEVVVVVCTPIALEEETAAAVVVHTAPTALERKMIAAVVTTDSFVTS
jgi:hypothetical protein